MTSPRHLALATVAAALLAPALALACPPPPPMAERLVLATPDGATIPADGALLVGQVEEYATNRAPRRGPDLTVRVAGGATLTPTIEYLADGAQRWRLPGAAPRDLEVIDADGKVIAHIHQAAAAGALPPPKVKRLTSTIASGEGVPYGIPASHAVIELAAAPAGLTLVAEVVDVGVWFTAAPTGRRVVHDTYASKGCGGGPRPVVAGTRMRFAWLATDGRMSAWSKPATVKLDSGRRDRTGR